MTRIKNTSSPSLYMLLLGCRPKGRLTEQHDVFFGIARSLKELIPAIKASWPEAKGVIHIDAFRKVKQVGKFKISVVKRNEKAQSHALFFINLGGYKPGEFDEFHYKMLVVGKNKDQAVRQSKKTAFYKHTDFEEAPSHVDDKYGVDVDELHDIKEILPLAFRKKYSIKIVEKKGVGDEVHLGYFKLDEMDLL